MSTRNPTHKKKLFSDEDLEKYREYQRNWKRTSKTYAKWREKNKELLQAYYKKRYKNNREEYLRRAKERRPIDRERERRTVLCVKGKKIRGLNKRPYTEYCEISGGNSCHLDYHHWDDNNPEKGIWISYWPHKLCELIDMGQIPLQLCMKIPWAKKYLELREKIEREYQCK